MIWRSDGSPRDIALSLAGQLRALDEELFERPETLAAQTSPGAMLVSRFDKYLIPRTKPKSQGRVGAGNGFGRRCHPHFRILPRRIDSYEVEPFWEPRLSAWHPESPSQTCGAALFSKLHVSGDPDYDDFVALSAESEGAEELIDRQIEAAFQQSMLIVAWPELSMPPAHLEQLQKGLFVHAGRTFDSRGPDVIAAGSWYEVIDGKRFNRMPILDRFGKERRVYRKNRPYRDKEVAEAIESGWKIPVLIRPDALITFGICLDFCDTEIPLPYDSLDVDLVVVVSNGNLSTMKGHEANALHLRTLWGCRAFVCQQSDNPNATGGFVLPPREKNGALATSQTWNLREPWLSER